MSLAFFEKKEIVFKGLVEPLIEKAVAALPDQERVIVRDLFWRELKAVQISRDLLMSESRVSQVRRNAYRLLRQKLKFGC